MTAFLPRLIFAFVFCLGVAARAEFVVPALTGPVVDQMGLLNAGDERDLDSVLRDYNAQGKAQIQVLVLSSLQDLTIEEASIKITDQWKLGAAKKDNGILFLIAPQEKKLRIEVGQGLEGALPDVIAKRIVSDTVVPYFKKGQMSAGVVAGVYEIIQYVDKEYADQHLTATPSPGEGSGGLPGWVIILILFGLIFLGRFGGGGGRRGFFGGYGGGYGGGGFGGFGGGGGGGGWSGGGGGFSGGGASGSW
jgi:uncharacterized protein